jgi:hypothetical protein
MGAPLGNQNAVRAKRWQDAINRALDKRSRVAGIEALDELAEKLLVLADEGDLGALKELGDRIEGKPAQTLGIGQDPDLEPMITRVERVIVRGNAAD